MITTLTYLLLVTLFLQGIYAAELSPYNDTVPHHDVPIHTLDTMVVSLTKVNRSTAVDASSPLEEFTAEDIITTAGTAEDISRYIATLPSVVSSLGENFDNSLYVRGGHPTEVLFLVDGIEMENINHFSKATGSGGPVGFINSEFVKKVAFYAGNEPSWYPSRLSSVVDVQMKSGSFTNRHTELGCKLTGGMFATEGPAGNSASYLVSGRYIDFGTLDMYPAEHGTPRLGDCLIKGKYLLGEASEVSLTGIVSHNSFSQHYPVWEKDDVTGELYANTSEERQRILQGGAGINYLLRGGNVNHQLTLAGSFRDGTVSDSLYNYNGSFFATRYRANPYQVDADARYRLHCTSLTSVAVGNVWHFSFGARAAIQQLAMMTNNTRMYSGAYTYCNNGVAMEGERVEFPRERSMTISTDEASGFGDGAFTYGRLSGSLGVRADYFRALNIAAVSPRASVMLPMMFESSMRMSVGVKHQFPVEMPSLLFYSLSWLQEKTDEEAQRDLYTLMEQIKPLRCYHAAFEVEKKVNDWVFLKSGVFGKWYDRQYNFISPRQQEVFRFTEKREIELLPQDGQRKAYGIEGTIENRNTQWLRYSGAASFFTVKNRYKDGFWYDDWTNVRYTLTLMLSTQFLHAHRFSLTSQVNGGRPYCREQIVSDCLGRKSTTLASANGYYTERHDKMITVNARYGVVRQLSAVSAELFIDVLNVLNAQPTLEYRFNGETFQSIKPFGITPVAGVSLKW